MGIGDKIKKIRFRLSGTSDFCEVEQRENMERLRDYLKASLQMQHLAILCGSGTSTEAGYPSMSELWKEAEGLPGINAARAAVSYLNGNNIEEFLSKCDAFTELNPDETSVPKVRSLTVEMILKRCRMSIEPAKLVAHQDLLKRVARRRARDSRVKLFTTNYDLCFESAAAELGLVPLDGFSFSQPRRFDPRFFDFDIVKRTPASESVTFVQGVFHYYKLHGSVDWSSHAGRIDVDPTVGSEHACLIYPARAKFQRSYQQPHLELMARYLATLREQNTCLVVMGFGFADAHLSAPMLAALRANPHFRLILVSRTIDKKLETAKTDSPFFELRELAHHSDVSFIAASFTDFVTLIPDLTALSPAHELEAAVLRVTGKPT